VAKQAYQMAARIEAHCSSMGDLAALANRSDMMRYVFFVNIKEIKI